MQISIFDYRDYKIFLTEWLAMRPGRGRGEKSRIAAALRCHTAYVTHVFGGSAHLSLEQASELSAYLGHREDEQRFFLLLVQLARASSRRLSSFLEEEVRKALQVRLDLKNRLQFQKQLSEEDQSRFYSAWYYLAVYAMVSVSSFQTVDAIASQLGLPSQLISEVLEFLSSRGIAIQDGDRYRVGPKSIHLASSSPMISKHHANWRIQALRSIDTPRSSDLHYSSVISLARRDVPKVRALLVKAIEEVRAVVGPSHEETVCAYALDLFEIVNPEG